MNTYLENFNSSTIETLNSQEQLLKKLELDINASYFVLNNAEKAFGLAENQFKSTLSLYEHKKAIKTQTDVLLIAFSQLNISVRNQKSLVTQTITDAATFAANIQVASTAIVKLAGDIGNALSIVNAADFGAEISKVSKDTYTYINETAQLAESLSLQAMQASSSVSEIISDTLTEEAKIIYNQLKNISDKITLDINSIKDSEQAMIVAGTTAHEAKTILENNRAAYKATEKAYSFTSKQLNLNLQVLTTSQTTDSFTVSFNTYEHHFKNNTQYNDPVSSYAVFVVKENNKDTFSLSPAETLLQNKKQYIEITAKDITNSHISRLIHTNELFDTDNEPCRIHEKYVVFVLVIFTAEFKKSINSFDDYLSAASTSFRLENKEVSGQNTQTAASAFLNALVNEVKTAEDEVNLKQLIVDTLQAQETRNQQFLELATRDKENELNNKNQTNLLLQNVFELKENSETALKQITQASDLTKNIAEDISQLANKLIFTATLSNKLQNIVLRQKALNPLISDDLVSILATTGNDSNTAVALTLVALKATFTAFSSSQQANAALNLECNLATVFSEKFQRDTESEKSIVFLSYKVAELAKSISEKAIDNSRDKTFHLNEAKADLNKATSKLHSLQAGLSAAKGAAGVTL